MEEQNSQAAAMQQIAKSVVADGCNPVLAQNPVKIRTTWEKRWYQKASTLPGFTSGETFIVVSCQTAEMKTSLRRLF